MASEEMEAQSGHGSKVESLHCDDNLDKDNANRSSKDNDEAKSQSARDISDIEDEGEGQADVEDIWDGEDPSEVEVENFCLPSENTILEDLNLHLKKRKVFVYPMKLMDLAHPAMIECIGKCSDFRTTYLQNVDTNSSDGTWSGLIELTFKTIFYAMEALDILKTIREDVVVRHYETDESATKRAVEKWISDNSTICSAVPRNVKNMLVLRRLRENTQASQLRPLFPSSLDIVMSKESLKSQSSNWNPGKMAYVFFNSEEDLKSVIKKHNQEEVVIDGVRLKLIPYQPPNFPYGLIKMKRRYKILRQIQELKKILRDQQMILNESSKHKIKMNIEQCKLTIDKDNKARRELGLPLHSLSYLSRIPSIRQSVPSDFDWMPQISFKCEDDDDRFLGRRDNKRRSKKIRRDIGSGWMDNSTRRRESSQRSDSYDQIARVHEIAAKIAKIASHMGSKSQLDADPGRGQNRRVNYESNKRQRSPEAQNASGGNIMNKRTSMAEESAPANQSRDAIKPLMNMQDPEVGWNSRDQQRYGNYNSRGGAVSQFGQGYNSVGGNVNQPSSFGNLDYDQASCGQYPHRQQIPQGSTFYNYSQNYDAGYPGYPGYGYTPNIWGSSQNMPWNPTQANYPWPNQL